MGAKIIIVAIFALHRFFVIDACVIDAKVIGAIVIVIAIQSAIENIAASVIAAQSAFDALAIAGVRFAIANSRFAILMAVRVGVVVADAACAAAAVRAAIFAVAIGLAATSLEADFAFSAAAFPAGCVSAFALVRDKVAGLVIVTGA